MARAPLVLGAASGPDVEMHGWRGELVILVLSHVRPELDHRPALKIRRIHRP
jgi:hypothetical protein